MQQLLNLKEARDRICKNKPPPVPPKPWFRNLFIRSRPSAITGETPKSPTPPTPYVSMEDLTKIDDLPTLHNKKVERTYIGFRPLEGSLRGTPRHPYPRITPLLKELDEENPIDFELESDSMEVESLCTKSTISNL